MRSDSQKNKEPARHGGKGHTREQVNGHRFCGAGEIVRGALALRLVRILVGSRGHTQKQTDEHEINDLGLNRDVLHEIADGVQASCDPASRHGVKQDVLHTGCL